jgi:hypothetical protein
VQQSEKEKGEGRRVKGEGSEERGVEIKNALLSL